MRKLSDVKGEDAILLWAELMKPLQIILSDKKVSKAMGKGNVIEFAKMLLTLHKSEVVDIFRIIDDSEEINAVTVPMRIVSFANEIFKNEEYMSFFGLQTMSEPPTSFGSATENTKGEGN